MLIYDINDVISSVKLCIGLKLIEIVQIRMGRAALNWSGRELANASRVSPVTIARLETGANTTILTIGKLQKALEKGGVIFIPRDASGGPGVRLKR